MHVHPNAAPARPLRRVGAVRLLALVAIDRARADFRPRRGSVRSSAEKL